MLVLMLSSILTGMIINSYNSALATNVLLAAFMPMLMGTGGNAGSQASVSVIRILTLGEIEFGDIFAVLWKEFRVSLITGSCVSLVNFARIMITYQDFGLATVVSITLFLVVIAAELVGCSLPMIATKLNLDPALMASPLITTIVDALSMLVFFNVAMKVLPGM